MAMSHNGLRIVTSSPVPHSRVTPPYVCRSINVSLPAQRIEKRRGIVKASASTQSVLDAATDAVVASATSVSVDGAVSELPWQVVVGAIGEQAFVLVP